MHSKNNNKCNIKQISFRAIGLLFLEFKYLILGFKVSKCECLLLYISIKTEIPLI